MDDREVRRWHDDAGKVESATDPLIDVIGYLESLRPTSAYANEQFATWVAREGRVHATAGERLNVEQAGALARRIRVAAMAEQSGVQLMNDLPESVAVRPGWPVSSAIVELAKRRQAAVVDLAIAAGTGRALWNVECEAAVDVPAVFPRGEYVALTVSGDSMEPLLHSGDLVLVRRSGELKTGAIVVIEDADAGYVVKKVGRIEPGSVELLSLNPAYERRRVRRTRRSVLGTVLLRWCQHD